MFFVNPLEIQYIGNQANTGSLALQTFVAPPFETGDLLLAIITADGGGGNPAYDANSEQTYTSAGTWSQSSTLNGAAFYRVTTSQSANLVVSQSAGTLKRCNWYVFRNATAVSKNTALLVNSVAPNPSSHTAATGYAKYWWVTQCCSTSSYTPTSVPTNYTGQLGGSSTTVTQWTAHRTSATTSNTEDAGAWGNLMAIGLAMTFAIY